MDDGAVISLYTENTCTTRDICARFGICFSKLFSILKANDIAKREYRVFNRKPNSIESRHKMSETMKRVHAEGRHSGWTAVNSKKEDSYPERVFLQYIKSSKLLEKYEILSKHSVGKYVLDFVIVELKINIELDGQYHFNDKKTIAKDIRRDEYMKSNGWKVYRISWTYFNKNKEAVIHELIDFIDGTEIVSRKYTKNDYEVQNRICKCGCNKLKTSIVCRKCSDSMKRNDVTNRKFEISKEELEGLIKEKPMSTIGKMFGVSDNAVKKRCRKLGIELKSMRGYWKKLEAGRI